MNQYSWLKWVCIVLLGVLAMFYASVVLMWIGIVAVTDVEVKTFAVVRTLFNCAMTALCTVGVVTWVKESWNPAAIITISALVVTLIAECFF